jgi:hypothetical protein
LALRILPPLLILSDPTKSGASASMEKMLDSPSKPPVHRNLPHGVASRLRHSSWWAWMTLLSRPVRTCAKSEG